MNDHLVVLIRFGDNDFYYTFTAVLHAIAGMLLSTGAEIGHFQNRQKLLRLINTLSPPAYEFCQSRTGGIDDHTVKYLTITEDRLLLGKEVDKFIRENAGNGNGEWYVLDTRLPEDQQVFSV